MRKEGRINWALPAAMAAAALVVGCGGGGVNGVAVTGKVMDGYLNGAQICLDVNDNKSCDANEPSATSGVGGVFSLNPPSNLDLTTVRLIANVPATAVDEDNPLVPVGTAYQLTAPANLNVVTPLTTLAMSYKDSGQSWAQAVESVKTNLGISGPDFKVDADYVAEANVKTHNVAKLVAGVIQTNQIQGSDNVRSVIAGLRTYANSAFNSATAMAANDLNALISSGAFSVRQRVFVASYRSMTPNWINELQVYMQGRTNTSAGIYGEEKSSGDPWYWSGDMGVGDNNSGNGAQFYWGTNITFPNGFIGSWVMEPAGFDITGMGKINIKVWGSNELAGVPRFKPVLESMDIDGCKPQAVSSSTLVAPQVRNDYILVNQSDAQFSVALSSFQITESCGGVVNTMSQFISRPLKTVRVRLYESDKNTTSSWNGINLGAISFEP